MKILNFLAEKLIKPAYAQLTFDDTEITCYLTGPIDPVEQTTRTASVILYNVLAPIGAFVLAIFHAVKLLKRPNFNLYNEIYKGFLRTLILAIFFWAITSIINSFYFLYGLEGSLFERFVTIMVSTTIAAGLGYLIISIKNIKIFKMALYLIFVLPALIVFLLYIILKVFPSLKKYAFTDLFETKKDKLVKKLAKQGTIKPKKDAK
ncbi:MAG: hypothetical protein NTZ49_00900 [Candidatus Parcubacteria bacterium]|nr:hypothetical protein [Candidatus Parcubacteria bacterium]